MERQGRCNDFETSRKKNQVVKSILKFAISVMMQDEPNIEILLNESSSYDEGSSSNRKRRAHFIDCLFSDSVFQGPNSTSEDKSSSTVQIGDGVDRNAKNKFNRNKTESLSLRQIAINFHLLSKRLNVITQLVNNVSGVVNWERDDKTLAVLLLYTWACIHSHFFLLYPLMLFMYYIFGKYLVKHPIVEKPSMYTKSRDYSEYWDDGLGPRLKNVKSNSSQGIFGFLWDNNLENGNDDAKISTVENPDFQMLGNRKICSSTKREAEDSLDFQTVDDMLAFIEDAVAKESADKQAPSQPPANITPLEDDTSKINADTKTKGSASVYRNFIMKTLFDIQVQTTQVLNHFDNIQMAIAENCEFIDEKQSTLLIFKLFLIISIGCILGSYIPWKIIFIVSVWIGICMNHPKRVEFFDKIIMGPSFLSKPTNQGRGDGEEQSRADSKSREVGLFSLSNVVINEPVFAREVQIFELQQQDIMKPNEYIPIGFTTNAFFLSEETRMQRRRPVCVYNINDVAPPLRQYKVDDLQSSGDMNNDDNEIKNGGGKVYKKKSSLYWDYISGENWRLSDTKWVGDVRCVHELYVKPSEEEGWVYDITGEFRRRRWVRRIFQHV